MAFMFEKLEVYQKAVSFADAIAALTLIFPRGFGFLSDQLNRAALSIATNLAEGNGRFTKPDRNTSSQLHAAPSRNAFLCWR
jgi:four helix bundle protein